MSPTLGLTPPPPSLHCKLEEFLILSKTTPAPLSVPIPLTPRPSVTGHLEVSGFRTSMKFILSWTSTGAPRPATSRGWSAAGGPALVSRVPAKRSRGQLPRVFLPCDWLSGSYLRKSGNIESSHISVNVAEAQSWELYMIPPSPLAPVSPPQWDSLNTPRKAPSPTPAGLFM